ITPRQDLPTQSTPPLRSGLLVPLTNTRSHPHLALNKSPSTSRRFHQCFPENAFHLRIPSRSVGPSTPSTLKEIIRRLRTRIPLARRTACAAHDGPAAGGGRAPEPMDGCPSGAAKGMRARRRRIISANDEGVVGPAGLEPATRRL